MLVLLLEVVEMMCNIDFDVLSLMVVFLEYAYARICSWSGFCVTDIWLLSVQMLFIRMTDSRLVVTCLPAPAIYNMLCFIILAKGCIQLTN